ncbi:MAG: hypothetical protein JWO19_683 [Bryobacterales bacterium]|nr:hypothetical protein [Bryobacterales bacterium]
MDIFLGMSILLALLAFVFIVMSGYANTVDRIALLLHRHAEQIRRMHASHDEQLRTWWQAEWRRVRPSGERRSSVTAGPVPIQKEGRRDHHREVIVGSTR